MANLYYEYFVRRYNVAHATDELNKISKKGFRVAFASMLDGKLVVVFEKEKRGPGRPSKKDQADGDVDVVATEE